MFIKTITDSRNMIINSMYLGQNDVRMLESARHREVINLFKLPHVERVRDKVYFWYEEAFIKSLFKGEISCIADGSFYPNKYNVILLAWFASTERNIVANRDFI